MSDDHQQPNWANNPKEGIITSCQSGSKDFAFTLIEVLITLTIVGVLFCLIGIGLSSFVARSNNIKCMSNLRQVAHANLSYAGENDGRIAAAAGVPAGNFWWMDLRPYLMGGESDNNHSVEVLLCPCDKNSGRNYMPNPVAFRSYVINGFLLDTEGFSKKLSQIHAPSHTAYASELMWWILGTNLINGSDLSLNEASREWHRGSTHVVFLDGHVEAFSIQTLYPGRENHWIFAGL